MRGLVWLLQWEILTLKLLEISRGYKTYCQEQIFLIIYKAAWKSPIFRFTAIYGSYEMCKTQNSCSNLYFGEVLSQ